MVPPFLFFTDTADRGTDSVAVQCCEVRWGGVPSSMVGRWRG